MSILVIEVQKDGKTMYLSGTSIFSSNGPLTANPMKALDFTGDPSGLERALQMIVAPEDASGPMSGIRVDSSPEVVEMEVALAIISRKPGREPKAPAPRSSGPKF